MGSRSLPNYDLQVAAYALPIIVERARYAFDVAGTRVGRCQVLDEPTRQKRTDVWMREEDIERHGQILIGGQPARDIEIK